MPPPREKKKIRQKIQFSQTKRCTEKLFKLTTGQKVSQQISNNEISLLPLKQANYFEADRIPSITGWIKQVSTTLCQNAVSSFSQLKKK